MISQFLTLFIPLPSLLLLIKEHVSHALLDLTLLYLDGSDVVAENPFFLGGCGRGSNILNPLGVYVVASSRRAYVFDN